MNATYLLSVEPNRLYVYRNFRATGNAVPVLTCTGNHTAAQYIIGKGTVWVLGRQDTIASNHRQSIIPMLYKME